MHIQVPDGYRCPLCPGHEDDIFEWSNLLRAPICEGCTYDIHNALTSEDDPVSVETERLKKILSLNFDQCRVLYFREQIEYLTYEKYREELFLKKRTSRKKRIKQLQAEIEQYQKIITRVKERS